MLENVDVDLCQLFQILIDFLELVEINMVVMIQSAHMVNICMSYNQS